MIEDANASLIEPRGDALGSDASPKSKRETALDDCLVVLGEIGNEGVMYFSVGFEKEE